MADILDTLSDSLNKLIFGNSGTGVIVSAGPGGPESEDETRRILVEKSHNGTLPLGYLAEHPGKGRNALGYGGSADAIVVDEADDHTSLVASQLEHARIARVAKKVTDRVPHGRYRMDKWYWLEGHSDQTVGPVVGPFSLFDGTTGVPAGGNSVQVIPVALPPGTLSPIYLLDRYPGAMYMSLFISSFAFVPTAGTMTGLQECWFTDAGGATAGLGIYNAASTAGSFNNINKQCSSPLTDPGLLTLGNVFINNLGIAGTPVAVRWQLSIGFIALFADPWFNEQMVTQPTKAENVRSFLPQDMFG